MTTPSTLMAPVDQAVCCENAGEDLSLQAACDMSGNIPATCCNVEA